MRYDALELSDPILSFEDFDESAPFKHALYVEGGVENRDNSFGDVNKGLNVFVRIGANARNELDCSETTTTTTATTTTTTTPETSTMTQSTSGTTPADTTSTEVTTRINTGLILQDKRLSKKAESA